MFENMEIRQVMGQELDKFMAKDERIVVLDADLGKSNGTFVLRQKYPDRAFDVGVAEQNMAGIAAGLAAYGFIPLIFSFTPFVTRRICDQFAISIAYAQRNVKVVGTDPGISAELNGATHMSVEDIGVVRSIPGLVIVEIVDAMQLSRALPAIIAYDGPVYLRMLRKKAKAIFPDSYQFNLFGADMVREGRDITILASGLMLEEALTAAEHLQGQGMSAEVINVHTIKPLDEKTIVKSAMKTGAVVTCENHNIVGGLYSAVCELLSYQYPVPVAAVGIRDRFGEVGKMDYLKKVMHLTADDIVSKAIEVCTKKHVLNILHSKGSDAR
jgi:transketolase